mmetsp:Transcript_55515/g.92231  ORF Transcript_55515/g.92231 Transcript_55515/m.92231 type:complete len:266 (-) Transcript_55515:607-1404(-)
MEDERRTAAPRRGQRRGLLMWYWVALLGRGTSRLLDALCVMKCRRMLMEGERKQWDNTLMEKERPRPGMAWCGFVRKMSYHHCAGWWRKMVMGCQGWGGGVEYWVHLLVSCSAEFHHGQGVGGGVKKRKERMAVWKWNKWKKTLREMSLLHSMSGGPCGGGWSVGALVTGHLQYGQIRVCQGRCWWWWRKLCEDVAVVWLQALKRSVLAAAKEKMTAAASLMAHWLSLQWMRNVCMRPHERQMSCESREVRHLHHAHHGKHLNWY